MIKIALLKTNNRFIEDYLHTFSGTRILSKTIIYILSVGAGENTSGLIFKFWKKFIDKLIFMFYN